ncbi:hypothetical protein LOK74_17145 [Brevibacillus humidisoli]|uniref:hypothetical protein n=1 Tax=Brevibacillus humidisoli TaxID=2895522 RepID=UPI001E2C1723|nr:hypothetical protein [Brevibacillus humidisoli]UFJ39766.1 hypothetical protein LOK74_17145 [Brevibacillus humidisoli]
MKKWLALLALCLAIVGCGDKDEQESKGNENDDTKTARVQQRNEADSKAKALSRHPQTNKQDLVLFINRAEHVFEELYYAASSMPGGKIQRDDGLLYRQLPPRFSSREKVIAFFSRYWSRPLAVQMYDNLDTKIVNGRLYLRIPDQDDPVLISQQNTTISSDLNGVTVVVQNAGLPDRSGQPTVSYRLERDKRTGQLEIVRREGSYGSKMFQ